MQRGMVSVQVCDCATAFQEELDRFHLDWIDRLHAGQIGPCWDGRVGQRDTAELCGMR